MKKVLENIFYNAIYQVLIIIIPIVTVPILSRVLGPELLGLNSYILSITQFLSVVILMGMNQLGVRVIAQANKKDLTENFWSLFSIQFLVGCFISLSYFAIIMALDIDNKKYFLLQIPYLMSIAIDISWFFQGIENFKKVVIRNTFIKISTIVLILLFIKTKNDLGIYMMIISLGNLVGNSFFWLTLPAHIGKFKISSSLVRSGLRRSMFLLLPQVAIQLYTSFDKTIVGIFTSTTELSYYDQSQKMARILIAILSSLSIVLMPRIAKLVKEGNDDNLTNIMKKSINYISILALLFCSIIFVNTPAFVPWFFGEKFIPMIPYMRYVSLIIVFISIGGVFSNQFAIALKKDKEYAIPLVVGACLSLLLNFLLVPHYGVTGATFTIIFVECIVMILRILSLRKVLNLKLLLKDLPLYVGIFVVTTGVLSVLNLSIGSYFITMAIQTLLIVLLFVVLIILFPNSIKGDIIKAKQRFFNKE